MATTIQSGRASSPLLTADVASRAEIYGGRGLVFDGVSDGLTLTDANLTSKINTSGHFTISVWIKPSDVSTLEQTIYSQHDRNAIAIHQHSNGYLIYVEEIAFNASTAGVFSNGVWSHLVVTYNKVTCKVYIDGAESASVGHTDTIIGHTNNIHYIGHRQNNNYYNGTLSDFKIYSSALTEAEVQSQYLKPESVPSPSTLVSWYPMCEANPESPQSIVYDHSEKKLGDSDWNGDVITYEADGYQSFSGISINTLYKVQYTIATRTAPSYAGSLTFAGSSSAFGSVTLADSIGTHTYYFLSLKTDVQLRSTAFRGTITDYSAKPILMGNHAITNFFSTIDEVEDGAFATATNASTTGAYWTTEADWVIGSNVATCTLGVSASRSLYQGSSNGSISANPLIAGKTYRVTGTVVVTKLHGYLAVGSGGANFYTVVPSNTADGATVNFDQEILANTGLLQIRCTGNGNAEANNFTLDNVTCKEVGISSTGFLPVTNEPVIPQIPLVKSNEKMLFDGVDDIVTMTSGVGTVSAFTVSAWVLNRDSSQDSGVYKFGGTDSTAGNFTLSYSGNKYYLNIDNNDSNPVTAYAGVTNTNVNSIQHIVCVYNGTSALKIYLNGVNQTLTASGTPPSSIPLNQNLYIGKYYSNFWEGSVDEISAFNVALSSTEIQDLFNDGIALDATTSSKKSNLLGYWRNDGVTTWQDRRGWSYLNFDGSNDNVENTSFTTHQTNTGTLSGWFIFNDLDGTQRFFGAGGNTVTGTNRTLGFSGPSLYFLGYGADWNTSVGLVVGSLYHLAVTWNGDDIVVYVNGTGYSQTLSALVTPTGTKFRIGENAWASGDDANMKCISASVYTATLSTSEIQSIYNNGHLTSEVGNSNIAHYWKMNNGSTVVDLVGDKNLTVNNATLNTGNNGNVTGSPDSITIREGLTSGKDGLGFPLKNPSSNVLRLNGSSEYLLVDKTGSFPSGDQSRSVTCWIKPHSFPSGNDQPIVFMGTYTNNEMFTVSFLYNSTNRISVWGYNNDYTGSDVLTIDNWWYVGVTYDSGTNTLKSYIGGGADNINPALDMNNTSVTDFNTTYGDIKIGRAQNKYFDGMIDEVKIYNRALSADEILKDFKHQKGKHKND